MTDNIESGLTQAVVPSDFVHHEVTPSICPETGTACLRAIGYIAEFESTNQADAMTHVSMQDSGIIAGDGMKLVRRMIDLDRDIAENGCSISQEGNRCLGPVARSKDSHPSNDKRALPRILTIGRRK